MEQPGSVYRSPQASQPASTPVVKRPVSQKVAAVLPGERLSALPRGFLVNRPLPTRVIEYPPLVTQIPVPDQPVEELQVVKPGEASPVTPMVPRAPAVSNTPSTELDKDWPRLRNILQRHRDAPAEQEEGRPDEAAAKSVAADQQPIKLAQASPSLYPQQSEAKRADTGHVPHPTQPRAEVSSQKPKIEEIEPVSTSPLASTSRVQPNTERELTKTPKDEIEDKISVEASKTVGRGGEAAGEVPAAVTIDEKPAEEEQIASGISQGEPAKPAKAVHEEPIQRKTLDPGVPISEMPGSQVAAPDKAPVRADIPKKVSDASLEDLIQQSAAETQVSKSYQPSLSSPPEEDIDKEPGIFSASPMRKKQPQTGEKNKGEALSTDEIPAEETAQTRQTVPLEAAWPVEHHSQRQLKSVSDRIAGEVETTQEAEEEVVSHPVDESPIHQALERIAVRQPTESKVEIIMPRHARPSAPSVQEQAESESAQPSPEASERTSGEREDASSEAPLPSSEASQDAPPDVQMAAAPERIQTDIGPLPSDLWRLIGQEVPGQEQKSRAESELSESHIQRAGLEEKESVPPAVQNFFRPSGKEPPIMVQRVTEQTETQTAEQPSTGSAEAVSTQAPEVAQQEQKEEKINVEELARKIYEAIRHRLMTTLSVERERMRRNP